MGLFVVYCLDKPDSLALRLANRAEHLAWVPRSGLPVRMAGPMFQADATTFAGSLFVVEAGSEADVRAWSACDPYVKAGLFAQVDVRPFKWLIGAPDGLA
jgi:uncharacterized protein YciI